MYYICRDYLGSITHFVSSNGSLTQELSYDAWGRLSNPVNHEAYRPGSEPELFLGRGYTGHSLSRIPRETSTLVWAHQHVERSEIPRIGKRPFGSLSRLA